MVLRGNTHDFCVFGGFDHDVAVWYLDDNVLVPPDWPTSYCD